VLGEVEDVLEQVSVFFVLSGNNLIKQGFFKTNWKCLTFCG